MTSVAHTTGSGKRGLRTVLSITILWRGEAIAHRNVPPGERFVVAAEDADFVLPESIVGQHRHTIATLRQSGQAVVTWKDEEQRLEPGDVATLDLGVIAIRISHEAAPAKVQRRRSWAFRHLASQALSALVVCSGMLVSAHWVPSAEELADESDEQRYLIKQYLDSAAEIEAETMETEMESAASGDREGGTGTRAKGDEGSMGNPQSRTANRYGVAGPGDPYIARQAVLRDAAEFGMIGTLNSGAAGDADTPTAPWGRDDSLGVGVGAGAGAAPLVRTPIDAPPGRFADYGYNTHVDPTEDAVSTFAVDVDTGSLPIVRRSLEHGQTVMATSVRPEEVINYFDYGYPGPTGDEPFAAHLHAAPSPFDAGHHVVRVGLQAKRATRQVPAHLVYLVDTSGSMQSPDKICLVKQSLRMLTTSLRPGDTVALCTYAGSVREVLAPTGIDQRDRILAAIEQLSASGSTAMGSGIALAYGLAERTLVRGHINRVVVLSDGDANVGPSTHDEILETIDAQRRKGITLSTVGVGTGNYNDVMMEQLANKGDGNYQYIDDAREARRVFVDQLDGMLEVVAKDVKIQVEFDPSLVASYRLIGYENRDVADKDFRDDSVDGGEIGSGHNVTAVYDVVLEDAASRRSWVTLRVRHKQPHGDEAAEQVFTLEPENVYDSFDRAQRSLRFATAAAGFAEVLRRSPYAEGWTLKQVADIARSASDGTETSNQLAELATRAQELGQG